MDTPHTEYTYDPLTFRVIRIYTIRTKDNACLQDLNYTYDPVGNITELRDNAQKTTFYDNARVEPVNYYEYDALYRLIHAEGREHAGQNPNAQPGHHNHPIINTPHPNDVQAMRNYTEDYAYDEVGNIEHMDHKFANGGWKRNYVYEELSNRLESTSLPSDDPQGPYSAPYSYSHDEHGNMTGMPHLPEMCWDFKDQMCQVDLGGGGTAYYIYDAGGQRTRKVHEHNGSTVEERIYLGGYEIYRKHNGTGLTLERETLHIMDDQQRIALVETKTVEDGSEVLKPKALVRYQLNNHLGSSSMELDEDGVEISYEEYYPYGSTSYQAVDKEIKVAAKRYRYTGKERDDETGLYYYGARYYAAWLGRWVSCDPAGVIDGLNIYNYVYNNPTITVDLNGNEGKYIDLGELIDVNKLEGNALDIIDTRAPLNVMDTPLTPGKKGTARKHADKQARKYAKEAGLVGNKGEVQVAHTAASRHASEAGISPADWDKQEMQELHSHKNKGLNVEVKNQQGKTEIRTRHTAQEGMINDAKNKAVKTQGYLSPQGQLDSGGEVYF